MRRSFVVHPGICNRDAVALLSSIRPEPAVLGEPSLQFLPPRMRLVRRCETFRPRVSIRFADRDVPATTDFIDFTADKFTILLEEMEHGRARASHESYQDVSARGTECARSRNTVKRTAPGPRALRGIGEIVIAAVQEMLTNGRRVRTPLFTGWRPHIERGLLAVGKREAVGRWMSCPHGSEEQRTAKSISRRYGTDVAARHLSCAQSSQHGT